MAAWGGVTTTATTQATSRPWPGHAERQVRAASPSSWIAVVMIVLGFVLGGVGLSRG